MKGRGIAALVLTLVTTSSLADFKSAFEQYQLGEYVAARREFTALAALEVDADELARLRARLSPEAVAAADRIVATYGRAALAADVLPRDWQADPGCVERMPGAQFVARPSFSWIRMGIRGTSTSSRRIR